MCFVDRFIKGKKIKREKKPTPPKAMRKINLANVHSNEFNERVDSHSTDDRDSESSLESEYSSVSSIEPESYNSHAYVSKSKKKKKMRPPKLMRKLGPSNVHQNQSNERVRTKQNASKFVVTEVEPTQHPPNAANKITSSDERTSPKIKDNVRRLALVKYQPRSHPIDENWENDQDWTNISDEDTFGNFDEEPNYDEERNYDDETNSIDIGYTRESNLLVYLYRIRI